MSRANKLSRDLTALQHAHDLAVDMRYGFPVQPVRIIRPGDPDFEAIAATITPIERVRNGTTAQDIYYLNREIPVSWEAYV